MSHSRGNASHVAAFERFMATHVAFPTTDWALEMSKALGGRIVRDGLSNLYFDVGWSIEKLKELVRAPNFEAYLRFNLDD